MEKGLIFKDDSINDFDGSVNKHLSYNIPTDGLIGRWDGGSVLENKNELINGTLIYDKVLTKKEIFLLFNKRKRNIFDKIKAFGRKILRFLK